MSENILTMLSSKSFIVSGLHLGLWSIFSLFLYTVLENVLLLLFYM